MSNSIRFGALDTITRSALEGLRKRYKPSISQGAFLRQYVTYDPDKLQDAVNDYFRNLDLWKDEFLPLNNNQEEKRRLDRHKVASLSAHYYLKHRPLSPGEKADGTGLFLIPNEFVSLLIALSKLQGGERPYEFTGKFRAAMLRIANKHMKRIQESYDAYELFIPDFIHILSTMLYSIEVSRAPR